MQASGCLGSVKQEKVRNARHAVQLLQLGALTKGDRRGCCDGFDLARFSDVTSKWGDRAVEEMWTSMSSGRPPKGSLAALREGLLGDDSPHRTAAGSKSAVLVGPQLATTGSSDCV